MPSKTPKTGKTFVRHVAPFAPVALAMMMSTVPPKQPHTAGAPTTPSAVAPAGAFTVPGGSTEFHPVCSSLPFHAVLNAAIDNHCSLKGGSTDPAKQAESQSKNNFCSETPTAEALSYTQLLDMQKKSTEAKLQKNMPDRSQVEGMGEGKYVSYVAFVKDAHYSDVSAGEAVNCNIPGNDSNDIHIVLVPDTKGGDPKNADECTSTTAEMSPHFRPAGWTPDNIMKASAGHPIRVSGHLFYDGSHSPCTATSRPNPKRASLWEVHPVYSFEVCSKSTVAECQSAPASDWTPLEKVFASEQ
ncbi:MAG TPA: hypothetical protein VNW97_16450 [Candidatus Saccharimonadales bacterium]|nr:hypothetical protein [Candidatus Saccharimonadales bacterium]